MARAGRGTTVRVNAKRAVVLIFGCEQVAGSLKMKFTFVPVDSKAIFQVLDNFTKKAPKILQNR
ncbi:hypothetical protein RSK20926_01397 [Roseobacter sp. SK209-2-6]|nr:hypothetical protein RSK20926_01397 [Roseobacter sp. SK209-2-6]